MQFHSSRVGRWQGVCPAVGHTAGSSADGFVTTFLHLGHTLSAGIFA